MIRSNTTQSTLRTVRKGPYATRGMGTIAPTKSTDTQDTIGTKTEVTLTPEQERICDRATD